MILFPRFNSISLFLKDLQAVRPCMLRKLLIKFKTPNPGEARIVSHSRSNSNLTAETSFSTITVSNAARLAYIPAVMPPERCRL